MKAHEFELYPPKRSPLDFASLTARPRAAGCAGGGTSRTKLEHEGAAGTEAGRERADAATGDGRAADVGVCGRPDEGGGGGGPETERAVVADNGGEEWEEMEVCICIGVLSCMRGLTVLQSVYSMPESYTSTAHLNRGVCPKSRSVSRGDLNVLVLQTWRT